MKNTIAKTMSVLITAGIIALPLGATAAAANTSPRSAHPSKTPGASASHPASTVQVSTYNVAIRGMMFSPARITAARGMTVRWTNYDSVPHTVTSDARAFGSPRLMPGQSWSYTFRNAGNYAYHCSIHPTMTGMVVVR